MKDEAHIKEGLKDPVEFIAEQNMIAEEISRNFELGDRVLRLAREGAFRELPRIAASGNRDDLDSIERRVQTILLAYICAKQTIHHIKEESQNQEILRRTEECP
jgi:hypothetical protein